MLSWTAVFLAGLLGTVLSNDRPPDPRNFQTFDTAQKRAGENMCPYIVKGSKKLPVICWMCHFPHGLRPDTRYVYDCCPGYSKSDIIPNQCVQRDPTWKDLLTFLEDNGNSNTARALKENTAIQDLQAKPSQKVYTVFVPQNDEDIKNAELDYTGRDNSARTLVAQGRHYSPSFVNGAKIPNENAVDLKITSYSTGLTFVECRMLMSTDHETTNGLIHYTDGALPATGKYPSVMDRLQAEPDISNFVQALPPDTKNALSRRDSRELYTVFAPTNDAWNDAVKRLGPGASVASLANHHVLNKMICSGAIIQESNDVGPTQAADYIKLTLTSDGNPAVLDACSQQIPFLKKDLMSKTGVVHIIERVATSLLPLSLNEAINCIAQGPQHKLLQSAREIKDCDVVKNTKANVILMPDEEAFKWLTLKRNQLEEAKRMLADRKYKCQVYAHHMLTDKMMKQPFKFNGFGQEYRFETDYRAPNGEHPPVFSHYVTGRDGRRLNFNAAQTRNRKPMIFRDGVIYPVQKLNFPPDRNMIHVIENEPNLTKVAEKIKSTGMQQEFAKMEGKTLFLAPIDMGWKTRDLENGYTIDQTRKLLQLHTIPHALFGGEEGFLRRASVQTVDTLLPERGGGYVKLTIKVQPDGNTLIGHPEISEDLWAMVLKWNKVGTDGVVWVIDWPIKCPYLAC
ncbi:fasciclin domain protein [Opisthorchis viverrini]|uniref:Uncharacterized protein n=2 Tax=Opisthorchis viverrini TaxID=6198 RepID=A0A074YWU2_OPIVI|nr:hypothetical protein T265_11903 [Opisthorchis viverrini]KER19261.1 hypothetical protein T265_11903 [Opisthorchis viverrini]OON20968.1 fasciclin domain protein [Opisthorchis viverrini]